MLIVHTLFSVNILLIVLKFLQPMIKKRPSFGIYCPLAFHLSDQRLWVLATLALAVSLPVSCPRAAHAQAVGYGRGPNLNYFNPGVSGETFGPSSGVTCPTPTFTVGGYGGGGNDWSDNYNPSYASSSSGINNYGVAAGLRLPLGAGELSRACKDYAKSKSEYERINTENFRRNAQISLFRQCNWLKESRIKLTQSAFDDPAFSSLKVCSKLDYESIEGIDNKSKVSLIGEPVQSQVTTTTTQTLQVEGVRTLR